jgi:hypothetical protein
MEPSTRPTLPSVYEVAELGEESEETLSRKPRGVSKSRRAATSQPSEEQVRFGDINPLQLLLN